MPCCFAVAHATLSDRFSRVPYDACLGFPQTLAGVLSLARRTESLLRLGEAIHAATCGAAHLKEGAALAALTPPILQICCAVWLGRAAGAPACRAAPLPWGAQSKAAACRTCTSCQFRPRHGLFSATFTAVPGLVGQATPPRRADASLWWPQIRPAPAARTARCRPAAARCTSRAMPSQLYQLASCVPSISRIHLRRCPGIVRDG
mmetsp:Transcript_37423/g.94590  ORF Transcript_37423/g.94590 Transcript_37423/m.94590 type:complete len:205 (+) Transcript_37423:927-1541(+)